MKKIVILISGQGSNMLAIARALDAGRWPARIAAVVSNRPDAAGLAHAAARGIPAAVVDHRGFDGRDAFDAALSRVVDGYAPDLVVMAGFMRVLGDGFVDRYLGRMLNIHPSLLPGFPGLRTHQRVLDAGAKVHGATVHFVTATLDHGPIVIQSALPVNAHDDADSLARRVQATEHIIYPRAVRWFVEDRLALDGERAVLTPPEAQWLFAGSEA
jgi:phosphoribosylglycinamide formyltransferase-1